MVEEDRQHGKLSTLGNLVIPKNKSTSSLETLQPASATRTRFSMDGQRLDTDIKSPVLSEHEHGMGMSGLRRIRRQPPSRAPTLPPSPELSFTLPSRSSSISLSLNRQSTFPSSGPQSPALATFGEDLTRFPSESLHSYSFAHQSEEVLHDRQEIIRRSVDLVGEKLGWANHDPRILNAQAKVSGDAEMQSIVELLSRANILGGSSPSRRSFGLLGPLTGPAHLLANENVFEKGFDTVQSPISDEDASPGLSIPATLNSDSRTNSSQSKLSSVPGKDAVPITKEQTSEQPSIGLSMDDSTIPSPKTKSPPRPGGLKRSTTDVGPLYLKSKLEIALAKPYLAKDGTSTNLLAPPILPTIGKQAAAATPSHEVSNPAGFVKHRWTPAAQCLFTSEAQAPYTMQSANDLACLVFGVRKDQIRKISMMEMIRTDRREWLSDRLSSIGSGGAAKSKAVPLKPARKSPSPSTSLAMRGGITALLLSKPPSRYSNKANSRSQTDDGSGSSITGSRKTSLHHQANKSRGVLLCGDVVPIQKQNGHLGAATLWVKEKKGGLIWVLEEIVEDVAHLTLDAAGQVLSGTGAVEVLFGNESVDRKDIRKLIPKAPTIGTPRRIDYETMKKTQYYTVRNGNNYVLPASLSVVPSLGEVNVSTFPHIAGIMVLSSETLDIKSSNSVFSSALFGHKKPDGLHITEIIPQFKKLLDFLTDEETVELVDGIVIPEHSFRRARAMLAIREGSKDPAALFLRPIGLTAKHRDGTNLNIDVQMRVVRSESVGNSSGNAIPEVEEDEDGFLVQKQPKSEIVYALWITYSRNLHSLAPSGLPPSPLLSRSPTPPGQPSPGQNSAIIEPELMNIDSPRPQMTSSNLISEQLKEAFLEPISDKMSSAAIDITQDMPDSEPEEPPHKKTIADFQILEDMGQGAYGQVKLARYKKPLGQKVVLKYVTKKRILVDTWTRDRKLGTVPLEIHVLHYLRKDGLRHPNIVEMLDFFEDNTNYYIEMVPHGLPGMDLFDYIEMRATMEEAECRNIFRQVVSALHHLHTKALVVHRDIKDENIVLDGDNNVKLIDFGSAAYIKSGPFDVFVGTIDYAAPEVLQGRSYRGKEQDVWALGILLYTIIYKENPFYSVDEILDRELRIPWVMSPGSIELVRGMLNRDVESRMSIEDVVRHPWTRGEEGWDVCDEL